jgi:hypothetical protein
MFTMHGTDSLPGQVIGHLSGGGIHGVGAPAPEYRGRVWGVTEGRIRHADDRYL